MKIIIVTRENSPFCHRISLQSASLVTLVKFMVIFRALRLALFSFGIIGFVAQAQSAVLGFDEYANQSAVGTWDCSDPFRTESFLDIGGDYFAGDFQLKMGTAPRELKVVRDGNCAYDGSPSLFMGRTSGGVNLSRLDGGLFRMTSIDLDSLAFPTSVTVDFVGVLLNGSRVFQSFTTDALKGMQTFVFDDGFAAVKRVGWEQGTSGSYLSHFDNVRFDEEPVAQAPRTIAEPATLVLLLSGALGLGIRSRRRAA